MLTAHLCPTLRDPIDCSLPGSSIHVILQARILEWAYISFSRGYSKSRDQTQVSHIAGRLFTSWATREAQEHCSGQPVPSQGDLPDPKIEPESPALQADSLPTELSGKPILYFIASFMSVLEPLFLSLSRQESMARTANTEAPLGDSLGRRCPGW